MEFCALLLAAGDSNRFGADKRFIGSPPLLEKTLHSLYSSYEYIVLIHKEGDDLSALRVDREKVILLPHSKHEDSSLGASIAKGVAYLLESNINPKFCAIHLADMPFIRKKTIDELHQRCLRTRSTTQESQCIVRPIFENAKGHPVIFSEHFFYSLNQLKNCDGAKEVIRQNPASYREILTLDQGVIQDIDTPDTACKFGLV
ncbi:nucleotidyltransferase family protein [Vibrio profundum]|uniref:nucleotidyltransferase family protein n=1 Tax=Vibrio profundum TaxID=2910247 RepID=UPI003D0D7E08